MNDLGTVLSIAGVVVAVVGLVGAAVVRDRQVHSTIDTKVNAVREHLDRETANLHDRINRTREDMVRQSDLQAHTNRVEGMLGNVQQQLNMLIQRLIKE